MKKIPVLLFIAILALGAITIGSLWSTAHGEVDISEVQGIYRDPNRQDMIKALNTASMKFAVQSLSYAYTARYNQALEDYSIEVSTDSK